MLLEVSKKSSKRSALYHQTGNSGSPAGGGFIIEGLLKIQATFLINVHHNSRCLQDLIQCMPKTKAELEESKTKLKPATYLVTDRVAVK